MKNFIPNLTFVFVMLCSIGVDFFEFRKELSQRAMAHRAELAKDSIDMEGQIQKLQDQTFKVRP